MATIQINYDQALAQAKKLSSAAQTCQQEADKAQRVANELAAGWQGDSGKAIQEKYAAWIREQRAIATELNNVAGSIRSVVEELKREDEAQAAAIRSIGKGASGLVKGIMNALKGPGQFS